MSVKIELKYISINKNVHAFFCQSDVEDNPFFSVTKPEEVRASAIFGDSDDSDWDDLGGGNSTTLLCACWCSFIIQGR